MLAQGQSFREPEIEKLAMNFPGEGIQKIAIPYSERRGKIKFPNNAQVAVHIYVALEFNFTSDLSTLSNESMYQFNIAAWRMLEVLEQVGVKCTVYGNSNWPASKFADLYREYHRLGHEIAIHNDESHAFFTPDQEVEYMRSARTSIKEVVGELPVGYLTQGDTDKTIGLQIDEGLLWTGSMRDDDNPWIYKKGDKIIVEIPHRTATTGDHNVMDGMEWQRSPRMAVDYYKRTMDAYIATAEKQGWPLGWTLGIHPSKGCVPDRVQALKKMLEYAVATGKCWMCRYRDLAEYWKANYA